MVSSSDTGYEKELSPEISSSDDDGWHDSVIANQGKKRKLVHAPENAVPSDKKYHY
jgi:hypothetical protein